MKKLLIILFVGLSIYSCKDQKSLEKKDDAAVKLLTQAYLYGYPVMTMDYTHKVSTNVVKPDGRGKAPLNQWAGMTTFPKAGFTAVVRPNLDTYYSLVYADLSDGPLYLYIPETDRYYLMPILNAFGDVIESVGSRTTGQGALEIAFVGPDYKGPIDDDLMVIRSSTNLNWMLGRVAVKNDEDGKSEVANFQNRLISKPLAERANKNYLAPEGKVNPEYTEMVPMDAVDDMDISQYFNEMMALLANNPPYKADKKLMKALKKVGIEPGGTFDLSQFSMEQQKQIKAIPKLVQNGFQKMTEKPNEATMQNGWNVNTSGLGEYGTEYALRAYVTKIGYGANQAVDAVYPNAAVDANGEDFDSENNYVLHFDKEMMPPVKGFWSLTMYSKKGFLVDNKIDRYNLGSMKEMTYNDDGSLDVYIQAEAPKGKESNWLPSSHKGEKFELTFRMYWPEQEVINRTWIMPGVEKMD